MRTAKIIPTILLCGALAPGATTAAPAEELEEYRVEILVLRHLNNEARSFEAPPAPAVPEFEDTQPEQETERRLRVRYRGLPWQDFKLQGANTRLRRSRDFRPLIHLGWTQEAREPERAGWIPVRGQAQDGTRIDGMARLAVSRYLHLTLELESDIPEKGRFTLQQNRRMKSGELHYFDHPEFGALVLVIPEPPPPPPPEEDTQTEEPAPGTT